jgi:SAM-dependent methyltransferase
MLGGKNVAAVDPSDIFVHAVRQRLPEVDVRLARAEELPYPDRSFDWVLAQLVVHFMRDPIRGLAEMARVCAPGGVVAATVWDHAGGGGPLTAFWQAVHSMDASVGGEADLAGAHEGHLAELFAQAGMHNVRATALTVNVTHESFEEWWEPYTLGVGPAGDHVVGLDTAQRAELRDRCQALLPSAPFTLTAKAWTVAWSAPAG